MQSHPPRRKNKYAFNSRHYYTDSTTCPYNPLALADRRRNHVHKKSFNEVPDSYTQEA